MSEDFNIDDSGGPTDTDLSVLPNEEEFSNKDPMDDDSSHLDDGNSRDCSIPKGLSTDDISSSSASTSTPREATKDVPLSFELVPGRKRRYNQRKFSSFNDDGSYRSSICESVKLRQRRKSTYLEEDFITHTKKEKEKLQQKKDLKLQKVSSRRKSISHLSVSDAPKPAKISCRRQTMMPTRDYSEEESQDTLLEFPENYSNGNINQQTDEQDQPEASESLNLEFSLNDLSEKNSMTPPPIISHQTSSSSGSSSRRKSTLKPMETEIKFEKIVSYKNPTIPFKYHYRACIGLLNKIPHPPENEQLMKRLAILKVCHQYFHNKLYGKSKNSHKTLMKRTTL